MQSVEQSPSGDSSHEKSLNITTIPSRTIPPFIFAYDVPRGLIHAAQALLTYVLMLCVMYNLTPVYCLHYLIRVGKDFQRRLPHFYCCRPWNRRNVVWQNVGISTTSNRANYALYL